jgi:hypothetical protein
MLNIRRAVWRYGIKRVRCVDTTSLRPEVDKVSQADGQAFGGVRICEQSTVIVVAEVRSIENCEPYQYRRVLVS